MVQWVYRQIWGDVTQLSTADLLVGLQHWKEQFQGTGGHVFAERLSRYERELENE